MRQTTPTVDTEAWKQRYRAPITYAFLAQTNPARGLALSNRSGVMQLYAWDVATGEMRQITDTPEGKASGTISPDGRFIYYLQDEHGNEIGHFVRVPFEGGTPEDTTPEIPPYSSFCIGTLRGGNLLVMMIANS